MAKYHDLLKTYADEIQRVKDARRQADEARRRLDKFSSSQDWDNYDYATEAQLSEEWDQADSAANALIAYLTQEIQAEYYDVPFAKPRQQGIEKFWELAGI